MKKLSIITALLFILLVLFCCAGGSGSDGNGDDVRQIITNVFFDWEGTFVTAAPGSDNFATTWSDDDNQYTTYGDGCGFLGSGTKKSLGVSRISGDYDNQAYTDLWTGDGKSYGIISISGILYKWVGEPGSGTDAWARSRIYMSADKGASFTGADWWLTEENGIFCPTFLQMGRDYENNTDGYVYSYAPMIQSNDFGVQIPGEIILMRSPDYAVMDQSAYEFWTGEDWSPYWDDRQPVLSNKIGVFHISACYIPGLNNYVLITEHSTFGQGCMVMYQGPSPEGPFEFFYLTSNFGEGYAAGTSFFWNFAPKWFSEDGKEFVLIFTGTGEDDRFMAVKGRFEANENLYACDRA